VIRHGLRTLTKHGHPEALRLLGYDHDTPVTVTDLTVTPTTVPIGGEVTVTFTFTAEGGSADHGSVGAGMTASVAHPTRSRRAGHGRLRG